MNKRPKVWVLGNGQLGAMLTHAATPIGVDVEAIDIVNSDDRQLAIRDEDIVTAERELWPESDLSRQLSEHPNFINGHVFGLVADRFSQKSLLDKLAINTAPWQLVDNQVSELELHHNLVSERVLLKRRTGGYDGKGQHWLKQDQHTVIPHDWRNEAIAEQAINFDEEISLVGARTKNGQCIFYPLTLNLHQDGILMISVAALQRLEHLQSQAEAMLTKIMDELNYVGVMAMECFRVGDTLLVNELAPRVHNSGHWTQAATHIDQFQLHIRAVCNLPIPELKTNYPCAMVNLIGIEYNSKWLSMPNAELYWYQKQVRVGRKVGHINLSTHNIKLNHTIDELRKSLPEQYQAPLTWLSKEIS
ncbi:MAG: 5-(carboxyamino)imidazole ribonucleotide synthase [Parashewanella sp.]